MDTEWAAIPPRRLPPWPWGRAICARAGDRRQGAAPRHTSALTNGMRTRLGPGGSSRRVVSMIQDEVTQRKGLINVWIQLLLWESAGRRFISRRPNSPLSSSWGSSRRWMKVQWQVNPCALVRRTPGCSAFTPQRSRRLASGPASCFHPGLRRSGALRGFWR